MKKKTVPLSLVGVALAFVAAVPGCNWISGPTPGPTAGAPSSAGAPGMGGAPGLTGVGFTAPSNVLCPTGNYRTDCPANSPALPACARWAGCETDGANKYCTYTASVECFGGEIIACSSHSVPNGVITCDTTPGVCKFNAISGPGSCRSCGHSGEPCCVGPMQCHTGQCSSDGGAANQYTGTCP